MGSCESNFVVEVKGRKNRASHNENPTKEEIAEMEAKIREEFPDMKEWSGERYSGIGIKKMKGYKCNLPIDKLNEKRSEFWSSKGNEASHLKKMWKIIHQACVYDECKHINNFKIEQNFY